MIKNPFGVDLDAKLKNEVDDLGWNGYVSYRSQKETLKIGATAGRRSVDYSFSENGQRLFKSDESIIHLGAYASYRYNLGNHLSFLSGIRAIYYDNLNKTYLSPSFY